MIRFSFPVHIHRPVEDVFAYVTDSETLPEWQTNTVSVINETGGPLRQGSRLREVHRAPLGREAASLVEVSAFEPNKRFDLRILEGPLPIDASHTFTAENDGTRIDFAAEGQPGGPMRLLEPLLARLLHRQFEGYYAQLKQNLEGAAAP
jgi:ligand-binding SRPBCC domain-containing protein